MKPRIFSCLLCALVAGAYSSGFHILNNLDMFSAGAMVIVLLAGIIPLLLLVITAYIILTKAGLHNNIYYVCATLCIAWPLISLQATLKEISIFKPLILSLGPLAQATFFVLIPASIVGIFFKKSISKLTIVFCAVLITALFTGKSQLTARIGHAELFVHGGGDNVEKWFNPKRKYNVYFILADGLASFNYFKESKFDYSIFQQSLEGNGFTLYHDTYSNIHPTLYSMASMLNFRLVDKANRELARQAIANPVELNVNLKNAGYDLEYIHMADYLVVRGCAATSCFPKLNPTSEAKAMAARIFGDRFMVGENWDNYIGNKTILNQLETSILQRKRPAFRYIHHYSPGHSPHESRNNCDESTELDSYLDRVNIAFDRIEKTISTILKNDKNGVIIIAGDHGPWISNNCTWRGIPQSTQHLRDRIGAAIAVRWPASYNGRYDKYIFSTVNLIKYVLYSLNSSESLPPDLANENLYVLDTDGTPTLVVETSNSNEIHLHQ